MSKKLLKILRFPFFIFVFLYGFIYIIKLIILATFLYGILILWIINDPTFGLNKLLYFLAVTLAFIIMIYFEYFYNEEKNDDKTNNPIEQDTEAMMSFNN